MSVEVVRGGQRRIDRVLDPRFVADVGQLDLAELRSRREEAEAEEADISYLRRLLQGRLDILRAELVRRSQGGEQDVAGLLAGLPAILTDDAPGGRVVVDHQHAVHVHRVTIRPPAAVQAGAIGPALSLSDDNLRDLSPSRRSFRGRGRSRAHSRSCETWAPPSR